MGRWRMHPPQGGGGLPPELLNTSCEFQCTKCRRCDLVHIWGCLIKCPPLRGSRFPDLKGKIKYGEIH